MSTATATSTRSRTEPRTRRPDVTAMPAPRFGRAGVAPWVEGLTRTLDSRYRVPVIGYRFGIDGLIGLVPVVGDLLSAAYGALLVIEAWRLRVPSAVVAKMVGHLAADAALGSVPLVGDAIDFLYKPNERNLRLLRAATGLQETSDAPSKRAAGPREV